MIVRIIVGSEHFQIPCMVAGIRAPATARTDQESGNSRPAEPFAKEAHQFVESALLQRTVTVTPVNVSPYGVLIGTVEHSKQGSIAEHLLKVGYARCNDADSTSLGVRAMAALRDVERQAKNSRLGIFSTAEFANQRSKGSSSLSAVVYQVVNADTIVVRVKDQKRRVSLSSVRQPMPSDPKQSRWIPAAKEHLRSLLIGKHVQVSIDGKRPGTDGYEDREMATVVFGGANVALGLIREGLVSVVRHRQDDLDRSPYYDEFLEAQEMSKSEKKGIWSDNAPAQAKVINYSESAAIANRHINRLSHSKRLRGMIDYVINGSRFVVHMKDGDTTTSFILVIAGIQTPRTGNQKTGEPGEPFSEEAREVANRRCLQRDVSFSVGSVDKNGGFIGSVYVNNENFAKHLVEQGLAKVHDYSADKVGQGDELRASQTRAQEARVGLWKDWDPEKEAAEAEALEKAFAETKIAAAAAAAAASVNDDPSKNGTRPVNYKNIVITSIDPETLRFKFQAVGAGTEKLKGMMDLFDRFHQGMSGALSGPPRTGEFVSAKFTYDGRWYRARVQRVDADNERAVVCYIDYGNTETVAWSSLRPLPDQFNVSALAGQANDGKFAFLTFPRENRDSFDWLTDSIMGRTCKAIVEQETASSVGKTTTKVHHITLLGSPDAPVTKLKDSINAQLVEVGLAVCTPTRGLERWEHAQGPVLTMLRKLEVAAQKDRRGCWEYGEASIGDD